MYGLNTAQQQIKNVIIFKENVGKQAGIGFPLRFCMSEHPYINFQISVQCVVLSSIQTLILFKVILIFVWLKRSNQQSWPPAFPQLFSQGLVKYIDTVLLGLCIAVSKCEAKLNLFPENIND